LLNNNTPSDGTSSNNNALWIGVFVLIVFVIFVIAVFANSDTATQNLPTQSPQQTQVPQETSIPLPTK